MKCLLAVMLGLSSTVAWGMDADDFRVLNEIRKDALQVLSNRRFLTPDEATADAAVQDILRLAERLDVGTMVLDVTPEVGEKMKRLIETLNPKEQPETERQTVFERVQSQRQRLVVLEADLRKILVDQMTTAQRELEFSKTGRQLASLRGRLIAIQNNLFGTNEAFDAIEYDLNRWIESAALVEDMAKDEYVKKSLTSLGRQLDERKALQHAFSNVPRLVAAYFDTVAKAVVQMDEILAVDHESACETSLTAPRAEASATPSTEPAGPAFELSAVPSETAAGTATRPPLNEIIPRNAVSSTGVTPASAGSTLQP